MKTKFPFSIILIAAFFLNIHSTFAQVDSCIIFLKTANSNFEQRDFDGTIKLLQNALSKCNLDKTDKIQSHKLLALSYLAIDNLEAAGKEAETIIKINPNYYPDKFKDDPKFSALFEKFKPTPVFRIGIISGINVPTVNVSNTYSIVHNNNNAANFSTYNNKTGFQLGLVTEYRCFKNLWVQLEGLFRQTTYEHILDSVENTTVNYSERLSYLDVPLAAKYYFLNKKISPYLETGATLSFLTNALSTTTRDLEKDIVNRTDYRNNFMLGYFLGAGVSYKIKSFNVFANVRYSIFNKFVNKENTRFSDEVNTFKYYYIDNDFSLNNLQINFGATYNVFYKNKKAN